MDLISSVPLLWVGGGEFFATASGGEEIQALNHLSQIFLSSFYSNKHPHTSIFQTPAHRVNKGAMPRTWKCTPSACSGMLDALACLCLSWPSHGPLPTALSLFISPYQHPMEMLMDPKRLNREGWSPFISTVCECVCVCT